MNRFDVVLPCLLLFLSLNGCGKSEAESQPVGPFQKEVLAIWNDADVGTDPEYRGLVPQDFQDVTLAPRDLREIATTLAGDRVLRGRPFDTELRCDDGYLRLLWSVTAVVKADTATTQAMLETEMDELGYSKVARTDVARQKRPLGLSTLDVEQWTKHSRCFMYARQMKDTTATVLAEVQHYVGGRNPPTCGVSLRWYCSRPLVVDQPTLNDALEALPDWFQVSYLKPEFYDSLGGNHIVSISGGRQHSIKFLDNVYDDVVASLEDCDFEFRSESEPRNASVSCTWQRYSDFTSAGITTFNDSDRIRFFCSAPQHKGPPRKEAPLPLHPSLKLPMSKRPLVEFDSLQFADSRLKEHAEFFHTLGEDTAEKNWLVRRYHDSRWSNRTNYTGKWVTANVPGANYRKEIRPYRSIHLTLTGPDARFVGDHIEETIDQVSGGGMWIPLSGWGATVRFEVDGACYAWVRLANAHNVFSFAAYRRPKVIRLTGGPVRVRIEATKSSPRSYQFSAKLPYDSSPAGIRKRQQNFFALFESADRLKMKVLADIEQLRQIVADAVDQPANINVKDHANVSSANPPRRVPGTDVSEHVRRKLLRLANEQLDAVEEHILASHHEIFAAITKAMPNVSRLKVLTSVPTVEASATDGRENNVGPAN